MLMQPHILLLRQLRRLSLNSNELPSDLANWQLFLQHVSDNYVQADQDRYLIERSLEISSREMSELNAKLEAAQHIAGLGYWSHDILTGKIFWSTELRHLFGYNSSDAVPVFEELIQIIHVDDKLKFQTTVDEALKKLMGYEIDLRIWHKKQGKYRWFHCIGYPYKSADGGVFQLSGTAMDITQQKEVETQLVELNQQLLISARRAGMAEVATAVLHNIGNVLNSVNVSIGIVLENLNSFHLNKLIAVANLFKENLAHLNEYLTEDPKGKLLPQYLIALSDETQKSHNLIYDEVKSLNNHISHIKDIIFTQQSLSGSVKVMQEVAIDAAFEEALQISGGSLGARGICVEKDFLAVPTLVTDKSKLYQILVNLIQNAKEAVIGANNPSKKIILGIKLIDKNRVSIIVEDNGVGILEENITKIFSFGFTTKKNGHGFGLHSSAIAAKELGGSLQAESLGMNKGAKFILILPRIFTK